MHRLPAADASSDTMIRPTVVYPDTPFPEGSAMHEVRPTCLPNPNPNPNLNLTLALM